MNEYRITTTTAVNATVVVHPVTDRYWSHLAELQRSAIYSSIVVEHNWLGEWQVYQAFHYNAAALKHQRAHNRRITDEKRVFKLVVESALKLGYAVSLHDGEVRTVNKSTSKAEILNAGQSTDCDTLRFFDADGEVYGFVFFVYGNSASEVMNDWSDTTEINAILADARAYCDKLENKGL